MSRMLFMPIAIGLMQLRKWKKKPEICLIFICLWIFISSRVIPVHTMMEATGVNATPYLFPFLFADSYMNFFILAGGAVLFVEAPFWSGEQNAVLVRTGRSSWVLGQLCYILLASILYLTGVLILSILVLMPRLQWINTWGSIWNTIAQTDAAIEYNMNMEVSYYIISRYSPAEAMIIQFLLGLAVLVFVGVLFFFLNLNFGRKTGVVIISVMVLFTIRINSFPEFIYWIFPTVWADLECVTQEAQSIGPTLYQAEVGIILLNIICVCLILITGQKKDLV